MKRLCVIIALSLLTAAALGNGKYTFLKPDKHGKKVKIQVKGKDWTYYRLDRKNPLEFTIVGPTTIRVITRLDVTEYDKGRKVDYTIECAIDDKNAHFSRSALLSKGVNLTGDEKRSIGAGRHFDLKLNEGSHNVKLYLQKKSRDVVYIRLLKEGIPMVDEPKRVAIAPLEFTSPVKILVRENEFDYYRIGPKDSLKLEIIGPATVKVLSRLEYDVTMNGELKYRLAIFEDGSLKNTFLLSTRLSDITVYKDAKADKRLARGDTFHIEVPKGKHIYTFKMRDNGWTSLQKFYIPADALDNTIR